MTYQIALLPGLLQTVEYRRAMTWVDTPLMPTVEIERRMSVFAHRKVRLTGVDNLIAIDAVLDECLLRRAIGGPAVMADQLAHLASMSELPNGFCARRAAVRAGIHWVECRTVRDT
ncbi:Scr1 family TA system antitoxin-like transcriptional regulator [Nocardia xishanensis]|uniref:Scr1 family TA system antitoxin-like transcriptional regulator n=1 Tax=Nocardia xishanensis TaxID=238964 RepID=UPI0033DE06D8